MASCLVYIGRFLFFVLAGLQAYSLALYPAKYKHKDSFFGLVALYFPAIVLQWLHSSYQPSGVSTSRDKDKRFRTVDNSQMDS